MDELQEQQERLSTPNDAASHDSGANHAQNDTCTNQQLSSLTPAAADAAALTTDHVASPAKSESETTAVRPRTAAGKSTPTNGSRKTIKKTVKANANKRRNIKKILSDDRLQESTLRALQEEQQRRLRLNNECAGAGIKAPIIDDDDQPMMAVNGGLEDEEDDNEDDEESSQSSIDTSGGDGCDDEALNECKSGAKQHNESIELTVLSSDDEVIAINHTPLVPDKATSKQINNNNNNKMNNGHQLAACGSVDDEENNHIDDDDDNDDECQVLSESEFQQDVQAKKDTLRVKQRNIYTNDELNVADASGQVLINRNHPPDEPDVFLLPYLGRNAKPHQIGGIRFIYDNIVESLARVHNKDTGFGCILAHAMGLGKTFQVVSFVELFLRCTSARRVLCILPINTLQNWLSEFNQWLPVDGQQRLDSETVMSYKRPFRLYVINDLCKTSKQRVDTILGWKRTGGVLLIGYEMFRILVSASAAAADAAAGGGSHFISRPNKKKSIPKSKRDEPIDVDEEERADCAQLECEEALLSPCLVVCDEGHRIKNASASIAKTLQRVRTKRRIVLTGYPLQNNLMEYWCMVDFVRPAYLGTRAEFANMFERPIMNGQCVDSTRDDVKLMRARVHVLHYLLEGFVQRRGHDVFLASLPAKHEYIVLLKMSGVQRQFYSAFMESVGAMHIGEVKTNPLKSFAICFKIWNHPDVLYKFRTTSGAAALADLDLPDLPTDTFSKSSNKLANRNSKSPTKNASSSPFTASPTASNYLIMENSGFNPFGGTSSSSYRSPLSDYSWADKCFDGYTPDVLANGSKILFAFTLIEQSVRAGDKLLLFSQSLLTLNLVEEYLHRTVVPGTLSTPWQKNKNYYRIDGSTAAVERERLINQFNQRHDAHTICTIAGSKPQPVWLFLLSTKAGCLGINLIGANRVIVLDASWNPCHDAQAVCRVYRYGQVKPCFIYRLISDHTMEKKIYDRQLSKQTVADRVVDEIQSENHFTKTEVEKLMHYVKEDVPPADLSQISGKFADQVLVTSCLRHADLITKEPYTHESLLIDKKEYQLSEREKASALRDYQNDKKNFPYVRPNSFYAAAAAASPNNLNAFSSQTPQPQPPAYRINQMPIPSSSFPLTTFGKGSGMSRNTTNFTYNDDFSIAQNNSHAQFQSPQQHQQQPQQFIRQLSSPQIVTINQPTTSVSNNSNNYLANDFNPHQNLTDVKINWFIAPNNLVIPFQPPPQQQQQQQESPSSSSQESVMSTSSSSSPPSSIVIPQGEKVFVFKTQKGCYLRTSDDKYIALRSKSIEDAQSLFGGCSSASNNAFNGGGSSSSSNQQQQQFVQRPLESSIMSSESSNSNHTNDINSLGDTHFNADSSASNVVFLS